MHSELGLICPIIATAAFHIYTWTTGSTASRCDGLATTANRIFLLVFLLSLSMYVPKWYFTSPDPSSAASSPANCVSIWSKGFRHTFASTLSLWNDINTNLKEHISKGRQNSLHPPKKYPWLIIIITCHGGAYQWQLIPLRTLSIHQCWFSFQVSAYQHLIDRKSMIIRSKKNSFLFPQDSILLCLFIAYVSFLTF